MPQTRVAAARCYSQSVPSCSRPLTIAIQATMFKLDFVADRARVMEGTEGIAEELPPVLPSQAVQHIGHCQELVVVDSFKRFRTGQWAQLAHMSDR